MGTEREASFTLPFRTKIMGQKAMTVLVQLESLPYFVASLAKKKRKKILSLVFSFALLSISIFLHLSPKKRKIPFPLSELFSQ